MTRIPLPFMMDDNFNLYHPVMDVGSSYSSLKEPVKKWLRENCQGSWRFDFSAGVYGVIFDYDEDAMLFAMRWS